MVRCLKLLIKHPSFWYNQIFEPFYIYNDNEEQIYNEIHISKWWWKQQKVYPLQATIIPILILSDKTVISLSHWDQTLWPVYITNGDWDTKIRQSQKRPETLLLGFIPIIHERLEDANNKNKDLKAKIYHMALKSMLQRTFPNFSFIDFKEIRRWWCYSTAWVYKREYWIGVCRRLQKTLLSYIGSSYSWLQGVYSYHRY